MPSSVVRSGWRSGASSCRGSRLRSAARDGTGPVQDEHLDLGAGVARGERLPVRPDPSAGLGGPGVVLGDDERPSPARGTSSRVSWASSRRDVRAVGEERARLRDRRRAGRSRPATGRVWRIGVASTIPTRQPCSAATAPQCASSPQPMCRPSGNGSRRAKARRVDRRHRADLHEARPPRDAARRAAASPARRRATSAGARAGRASGRSARTGTGTRRGSRAAG